jgi:hypothetical protein
MLRYLLDENVDVGLPTGLRQHAPELISWRVGDPGMPPLGTPDPTILRWCKAYDLVLVTNNRRSMPVHLADHLAAARHIPGIFLLNPSMSVGEVTEYLILAAYIARPQEYRDQILHLLSL